LMDHGHWIVHVQRNATTHQFISDTCRRKTRTFASLSEDSPDRFGYSDRLTCLMDCRKLVRAQLNERPKSPNPFVESFDLSVNCGTLLLQRSQPVFSALQPSPVIEFHASAQEKTITRTITRQGKSRSPLENCDKRCPRGDLAPQGEADANQSLNQGVRKVV